jgi:hypothetical protein
MRPATLQRYVVSAHDYCLWQIVVEAESHLQAISKAKAIYATDGFGNTDAFVPADRDIAWRSTRLVPEVVR